MSIAFYTQPTPDFSTGYFIQPSDWNNNFDGITSFFNTVLVPAVNTLINAPAPNVAAQTFFNARMTLSTGVPVTTADVTGAATLYLTPYLGNQIGLYNPSNLSWSNFTLSADISIAVPAGVRDLFDVYVYSNSGVLTLQTVAYNTQAVTNNPAAGNSVVCNCVATANFSVNDVISISDGSGSEDAIVTAVNTNTSVTLDWLVNSYATATLRSNVPSTPAVMQDGAPVLSSDKSKRYVGTFLVRANVINDTAAERALGNCYNRVDRAMFAAPTVTTYNAPTGTAPANNDKTLGKERFLFISPQITAATTYLINRVDLSVGAGVPLIFSRMSIDGVLHPAQGVNPDNSNGVIIGTLILSAMGSVIAPGRHVIQDYFVVTAGGPFAMPTQQGSTIVCSTQAMIRN